MKGLVQIIVAQKNGRKVGELHHLPCLGVSSAKIAVSEAEALAHQSGDLLGAISKVRGFWKSLYLHQGDRGTMMGARAFSILCTGLT